MGENQILKSDSTLYMVKVIIGEGAYGEVARCVDLRTNKVVAIKIHKNHPKEKITEEVNMLKAIRTLEPSKCNIVRFIEDFNFQNMSCLVFEMLDRSLWDLMHSGTKKSFELHEIRPVVYQLLAALNALKGLGLMYTDLKPDNVMLVNHSNQPFRIKLIDFGLVLPEKKAKCGMVIMPAPYRAPEVTLGLPLTSAIDIWGLGCLMAHLYFGFSIFKKCPYNRMKDMLKLLGQPNCWLLDLGKMTNYYFIWVHDPINPHWRFRTPQEYEDVRGIKPVVHESFLHFRDLDHIVLSKPTSGEPKEAEDRKAFLNLLKCCLRPNSDWRITTESAMRHSFVTMYHLVNGKNNLYTDIASQFMSVCHQPHLEAPRAEAPEPLTATSQSDSKLQIDSNTKDDVCEDTAKDEIQPLPSKREQSEPRETASSTDEAADTSGPTNSNFYVGLRIFYRVCGFFRKLKNR